MDVSRQEVLRVAALARLHFAEDELEPLARDMSAILGFVAQLAQVDVNGVAPMLHVTPLATAFREDEPGETLPPEDWLEAVPWREGSFPGVPRFVEE